MVNHLSFGRVCPSVSASIMEKMEETDWEKSKMCRNDQRHSKHLPQSSVFDQKSSAFRQNYLYQTVSGGFFQIERRRFSPHSKRERSFAREAAGGRGFGGPDNW